MAKQKTEGGFDSLCAAIKGKQFVPLYCFCGEESYFIDVLTELLEQHTLNDMEKAFNMTVVYGKDATARQIVEASMRPPMMAERQLVLVKEAQGLELRKEEEQALLLSYFKKPNPQTVLAFAYKHSTPDKRKSVWKELAKSSGYFESGKLYENQVGAFIRQYLNQQKFKIEDEAAELMVESTGTELSKTINELGKLTIGKPAGYVITVADVEREVGISREFSAFELNAALSKRDVSKAYKIAQTMSSSKGNPFVMTLAALYGHFTKIFLTHANSQSDDKTLAGILRTSPYFVKDYREAVKHYPVQRVVHILHLLAEYDLRSKGVSSTGNITEGELLREMIYRVLFEEQKSMIVEFEA